MHLTERLRARTRSKSLTAQHLLDSLVPLWACVVCTLAGQIFWPRSPWAVAWGLGGGVGIGLPVCRYRASRHARRIAFVRAKADLVAADQAPAAGDDLTQVTETLDRLARRLRERDEAIASAEQAARRAAGMRVEFLAAMNHELRTPLNAILGFGQVLDMSPSMPAEERESLQQVLRAGRHLLRLVNELLQISEAEGGQADLSPEPVRLAELVAGTLDLVQPMAAHRRVEIDISEAIQAGAWVIADRHRLQQVLLNLLTNAVKFNREGGHVVVAVAHAAGGWRVSVRDTGCGFADAERQRLFAPFDRLDAARKGIEGAGLGLALAKGLIERMNGQIGVDSRPGAGSTFWFELREASPLAGSDVPTRRAAADADFVVVHIEDNPANQHLVERVLEPRRIKVLAAMQGRLGITLAVEHQPALVLLDLNLPDTHGLDVLRALGRDPRTSDVPVLVISADVTPGQRSRALALGAVEVLSKPLDVAAFVDVVSSHLSRIAEPCPPVK
jgi:signal transduction histidine kinase/ActR/RegA family two-component response regulator